MINNELEKKTFIQKIKNIFQQDPITKEWNPKFLFINQCILAGSIAGFFIGGRIGARVGGVEHIETTKLAVYQSQTHAFREYQAKVFVGFVKNGSRYGWRAGVFSGLYAFLMIAFSEANTTNHEALSYIAAGASTGVIYKCLSGWRSMLVGGIIGSGISLPIAGMIALADLILPPEERFNTKLTKIIDETLVRRNQGNEDILTEEEARVANLTVTDNLIEQMEKSLQDYDDDEK